jgi:hypothetical protein
MIEITANMEAVIKQAILSFVATVNEDGTPNLSPKASLTVTSGVLYGLSRSFWFYTRGRHCPSSPIYFPDRGLPQKC